MKETDGTEEKVATTTTERSTTQSMASAPQVWQQVAFWSTIPAIILTPFWFAAGRGFFGAGGWLVFVTLPAALFVIFPYQLAVMILALVGKKKYLSRRASGLLFAYYLLLILTQISLVDGGDTEESIGSALTLAGVPDMINTTIFPISLLAGIGVAVALIVVLIIDLTHSRRIQTQSREK